MKNAESNPMFRIPVETSAAMGIDAVGQPWLRVGPNLARALPAADYERLRR